MESLDGGIQCCSLENAYVSPSARQCCASKEVYLDFLESFLKLRNISRNEDDVGAFCGKLSRDTQSHALRCASNENSLSNNQYAFFSDLHEKRTFPSTWNLFPPNKPMMKGIMTTAPTTAVVTMIQLDIILLKYQNNRENR